MEIQKPEETAKYVRIPVSGKQSGDRIVTITISTKEGIKALYAANRKKILTYLFEKAKGWTMEKAKSWIVAHKSLDSQKELLMKAINDTPQKFTIAMPILKTRIKIVKNDKGEDVEERFLEGVASGTEVDLVGDEMAPEAIQTMADSLKQHVINLNAEHDTSWQSEMGEITKLEVSENHDLLMETKLNGMSKAKDLWYALNTLNKKLGLSIGGYVKEYTMVRDENDEEGYARSHRKFVNIELDHIAVTSSPAYPKSWVSAISKSLPPSTEIDVKSEEVEEVEEEKNMEEKAKWDRSFIDDLPETAFAYIEEQGGKKDESDKTVSRSKRHFPHHNASAKSGSDNETVDEPHLRNALARCGQGAQFAAQALPHLRRHAKALGIGEEAKSFFQSLDNEVLVELAYQLSDEMEDEKLVNIIERSIKTMKKDSSLEADEVKKTDVVAPPAGGTTEKPATPDTESKEESPVEPVKTEEEAEKAKSSEVETDKAAKDGDDCMMPDGKTKGKMKNGKCTMMGKSEDKTGEEDSKEVEKTSEETKAEVKTEEKSEEKTEEKAETKVEEKTEEKAAETKTEEKSTENPAAAEVLKTLGEVTQQLKKLAEANESLQKKIEDIESKPAERRTAVEVDKGLGDETTTEKVDAETLEKERDAKIEKVKKSFGPNSFSEIQKIRIEYDKKLSQV